MDDKEWDDYLLSKTYGCHFSEVGRMHYEQGNNRGMWAPKSAPGKGGERRSPHTPAAATGMARRDLKRAQRARQKEDARERAIARAQELLPGWLLALQTRFYRSSRQFWFLMGLGSGSLVFGLVWLASPYGATESGIAAAIAALVPYTLVNLALFSLEATVRAALFAIKIITAAARIVIGIALTLGLAWAIHQGLVLLDV